jgi:hypothetical protein
VGLFPWVSENSKYGTTPTRQETIDLTERDEPHARDDHPDTHHWSRSITIQKPALRRAEQAALDTEKGVHRGRGIENQTAMATGNSSGERD